MHASNEVLVYYAGPAKRRPYSVSTYAKATVPADANNTERGVLNPANTATVPERKPAENTGPMANVWPTTPRIGSDRVSSPPATL